MKIKPRKLGVFLATAAFFAGAALLGRCAVRDGRVFADDGLGGNESYVTIFDEGQKTIVKSTKATVREVLENIKITIDEKSDLVEPGLDEEISGRDFYINVYRARPALVIDGVRTVKLMTASSIPRDVAVAADIELFPEDVVKITPGGNFLATGISFSYLVVRAKLIQFDYYGTLIETRTQADTIGNFLRDRNIELGTDDWLSVSLAATVEDGMALSLSRNGKSTIVVEEPMPHGETVIQDYSRAAGYRQVNQSGKAGKKAVTYEIEMHQGQEIGRIRISEIVTEEPVSAIITVGAKVALPAGSHEDWMRAAGITESDFGYANFIMEHESHWTWNARNKRSGAYGLCQSLPGNKMISAGADWETNPITQLRWCQSYAIGRYGSWEKAYQFWLAKKWW